MRKKLKHIKGWVYIISNRAMPGLIKIGYSTKHPELRAEELKNSGSPHPYVVEYEILIKDPYKLEQRVHKRLSDKKEGKEWFNCSVKEAIAVIKAIAANTFIYEQPRAGLIEESKANLTIVDSQPINQLPQVVGRCHQCLGDVILKKSGKWQYVKCTKCNQVFSKPADPAWKAKKKPKTGLVDKSHPILLRPSGDRCPYPDCSGKLVHKAIEELHYLKCSTCAKVFPDF